MNNNPSSKKDEFSGLIQLIEALDEPWGIKDLESKHIFMNSAARIYTNTSSRLDIEGRLDVEFPVGWSELADELIEHDKLTEKSARCVAVIETHYWNNSDSMLPYVSEKIPIYDSKKNCIGTMWNAKKFRALSPLRYIDQHKPILLKTEPVTDLFTKSELLIIFFALQRYSSKEIARKLNLSPRTVENRLSIMYEKTEVHSLIQFIEYCKNQGLDNYIPYELMIKGIQFI